MPLETANLDDYELVGPLGSGATAKVFEAREASTGRPVAIKMLDASARGSRELRERLAREAEILTGVESRYVSKLVGFGWDADQPFLVLERLDGETLADVLRREGRLTLRRVSEWIEQLLIGVRDCHNATVIHRDIKPSNIFLQSREGGEPVVKLIDFGVARMNELAANNTSLTSTHHLIGSMGYMAPEQLEYAKGVGPPADLYAVGVVVFRCMAGRLPFVGKSFEALTKLKFEAVAPLLSTMPGVAANDMLDELVKKSLALKPENRYATASEMLQDWWQVVAALDRDAPLLVEGHDVVFDDELSSNTLVDGPLSASFRASASSPSAPSTSSNPSTTLDERLTATRTGENAVAGSPSDTERIAHDGRDGTDS
jgi:serine/threonine-protein kinase